MTQDQWPAGKHYVETANLPAAFFANVDAGGDRDLLVSKVDGEWRGISWRRVADQVRRLASILVERGVEAGDHVEVRLSFA